MKKPFTKEKALEKLAALCSRSEQCEFDLTRKLCNWLVPPSDRKEIIDYLRDNRYLDDERFARSFTNDKARFSHFGPFRIRMELVKRKIPAPLIKNALEQVDKEVWKQGLLKNASAKARNLDLIGEVGYNNRNKLLRYLISRGFSSSSSLKAVEYFRKKQEEEN